MADEVSRMERKLLFFDIDGTILNEKHIIPESARDALRAARNKGHILMINTGRPLMHIDPQVRALPMNGYICEIGGHILIEQQMIRHVTLPKELCKRIRDVGYACGLDMLFESEEGVWYDRRCRNPFGRNEFESLKNLGVPGWDDTFLSDFSFDKFVCWSREKGDPRRFIREFEDQLTFIGRENGMMEVIRKGLSKAEGMELVMKKLGIPPEDTFAFGDGPNDLPMLHAAGTGVLLGNAPREMWPEADFISAPIMKDGLALALKHFSLI